jgi:hypothetical protein
MPVSLESDAVCWREALYIVGTTVERKSAGKCGSHGSPLIIISHTQAVAIQPK